MWLRRPILDLLDALAAAAPDAAQGLTRTREEMVALLVALFRPVVAASEASLRDEVARSLDAVLAERGAAA
ncbi:hypothetical protein [Falsiroseomonas sp. CW058]|uniref:hypothetical protein n=1 Tax=Falsiroseomonas sp. CW058 TaxID=3388664 RepID=UPI003D31F8A3